MLGKIFFPCVLARITNPFADVNYSRALFQVSEVAIRWIVSYNPFLLDWHLMKEL